MPPAPPPPTPQPPDAGTDIFAEIVHWCGLRVNTIIRVLMDTEGAEVALAELGFEGAPPVLPSQLIGRLDSEAKAGLDPQLQDAETFSEVLTAFGALVEATTSANSELGPLAGAEVMADFLDMAIAADLRESTPALWAILRALDLLVDDAAQLGHLGDLFTRPGHYLTELGEELASDLTSPVGLPPYVEDYAAYSLVLAAVGGALAYLVRPFPNLGPRDWLDPHGHDTNAFGLDVLYGWTPASLDQLDPTNPPAKNPYPHLMELLPRMLTVRADLQTGSSTTGSVGVHDKLGITFALVPPEHIPLAVTDGSGAFGLYVRLSGLAAIELPLAGKWQLTLTPSDTAAIEAFLVHGGPGGFVRGAATSGYRATIALERPADVSGSWVFGSKTGSHVEIQHARAALTVSDVDQRGLLFDLGVHADHVIVDIELGSDSFLRAVLPPSVRLDTKLGLGVELGEKGRGLYLDGGVALVVDLPVDRPPVGLSVGGSTVLGVVVRGLHLRVGLSGADPGGDGMSGASFALAFTIDAAVQIAGGVVTATVAGVGMQYALKQVQAGTSTDEAPTAGHWQPSHSIVPPKGVGLVVKSGPVNGGGYIGYDAGLDEYSGALQLHASIAGTSFDLTGLGMLDAKIPGHEDDWSLLVILTVQGTYQIGSGFQLTGLGGIFGHNHTIDTDAIAAGLRTKALDAILFPPDPVVQAPHIFAVWRQTLPIAEGDTVVGLMAQFSWGSSDLSEFEVALLVDFATPVQTVLLVSLRLHAPSKAAPLFRVRADGVARLPNFLLQAELIDSKLGTFPVSGGLVAVLRGSDHAYLGSIGGFNPHFTPPGNVPAVDRLRIDISNSSNPRVRLEAYAAITSQTFQLGARLQLHAAAGPLAVDGWLAFDGLLAWEPHWGLSIEVAAGLSLSFDGSPLMEIAIDILFEGPGPWHIHGYASLSLLFYTLSLPIEHHWGDPSSFTSTTADPLTLVREALSLANAWSAPPPAASAVVALRPPSGTTIPAHPLAVASCRQRIVPLGLQVTHVGNQPLASATTVDVTGLNLGGSAAPDVSPVTEGFAAGQFLDLTDDEKLSRPSFEPMRAGLASGAASIDAGNATVVATTYKTVTVDGATRATRPRWPLDLTHANAVLRPPPPATARPVPVQLAVASDTLRTFAGDPVGHETASLAAQHAGSQHLLDLVGVAGPSS